MRIANVAGRAKLVVGEQTAVDVAEASGRRFGPELPGLYDDWDDFRRWADEFLADKSAADLASEPFSPSITGPPSPAPKQVFAVALNYVDHAAESGLKPPEQPLVFAKYLSAFSGPVTHVMLPEGHVDWECELVVVISRPAHGIDEADGWSYVAGLTVGQDISERVLQRSGPVPQFGLGKSHPGFAPTGPVLVSPDEFDNPDDLALGCEVNAQVMQNARTSDMIFPVATLISYLSKVVTLYPGDVIFSGTPPGVGMGRQPPVFLQPGDRLSSHIEGIGELHQTFVGR
jgi:2-keto-4-pentenoate hydratase/2-oxohepta-3-ene-1,7-dioic acid hydratase in catechol pathway